MSELANQSLVEGFNPAEPTVQAETEKVLAQPQKEEAPAQPAKKVFTRADVRNFIEKKIVFPDIYPGYEPWGFKLRLKLNSDAEERRQQYLAKSAVDMTAGISAQALDEVCDLLVELPSGFGDLMQTGMAPGPAFKSYVESTTDPAARAMLEMIVNGANSAYWNAVQPREFRS